GRRVVGGDVAVAGEADHHHDVAVRAVSGAGQLVLLERLRGDHRDARADQPLQLGEGAQPGDEAVQAVAARVGDVERPVAGASVGVVVGVPGGVVDLGVGVGRV